MSPSKSVSSQPALFLPAFAAAAIVKSHFVLSGTAIYVYNASPEQQLNFERFPGSCRRAPSGRRLAAPSVQLGYTYIGKDMSDSGEPAFLH